MNQLHFNVHCEPKAAHICLTKFKCTRIVTWETVYKYSFDLDWYNNLKSTKYTDFIKKINKTYLEESKEYSDKLMVCDLIAMTSYLTEADRSQFMNCKVELSGKYTRGATIFNWMDNKDINCKLIKIDMNKVYKLVTDVLYKN